MALRWGLFALIVLGQSGKAGDPLPAPPPPEEWDLRTRLQDLEDEVARLQALVSTTTAAAAVASTTHDPSLPDELATELLDSQLVCCSGWEDGSCPSESPASWFVGLELAVLEPHVGSLRLPASGTTLTPDFDFETTPRLFGGFQSVSGLSGQITGSELDTTGDNRSPSTGVRTDLDLETFDIELSQTGEFAFWTIQIGAGLRWAQAVRRIDILTGLNDRHTADFQGGGPVLLVNVHRPVGLSGLALVGEARASFLFGDTDITSNTAPAIQVREQVTQVWEGRFGLEWSGANPDRTRVYFVRGLIEAHVWETALSGSSAGDLGLVGPTLSAGFVF